MRVPHDDRSGLGAVFFVAGGQGADELVGDVREEGGAASGDAVSGGKDEEVFKEAVEAVKGVEVFGVGGELVGEVVGLEVLGEFGVARAETGIRGRDELAAAGAIGEAMLAARGIVDRE